MNSLVYSLFIVNNFYNEMSLMFQDKRSKDCYNSIWLIRLETFMI